MEPTKDQQELRDREKDVALLGKVTAGPWHYDEDGDAIFGTPDANGLGRVCDFRGKWALFDPRHEATIAANKSFIMRCRQRFPKVVADRDAAEKRVAELEKELARLQKIEMAAKILVFIVDMSPNSGSVAYRALESALDAR